MHDSDGNAVGIFKGAIDESKQIEFTLADEDDEIHVLKAEEISKAEYGTVIAFIHSLYSKWMLER